MLSRNTDLVPDKKRKTSLKKIILGIVLGFFLGQGTAFLIHKIWIFPFLIENESMEPHFKYGQEIYIHRFFSFEKVQKGDILFITHPSSTDWHMLRRVVALPGDTVELKNHELYINGQKFQKDFEISLQRYRKNIEPDHYTDFSDHANMPEITLARNQLFVMADNRRISLDSRHFGPISSENILGMVKK